MRVNVYVDGFNLYRGGAELAGRNTPGWKWMDVRAMAGTIANAEWAGGPHAIERVVYCTARVIPTPMDPDLPKRQESPLGIVNPGRGYTAGALHHNPATDVAGQWERQLTFADFSAHQLPDPVGAYAKPPSW